MKGEQGPRLCCGQRGSMRADIKVLRMDRDERGKVWMPYETTGREQARERGRYRTGSKREGGEEETLKQRKKEGKAEAKRESD